MKIYDTQIRDKKDFAPLENGVVKFYACGITPYDHSHLGHLVSAYRFNLIRKYLEFSHYEVKYVQNVTDLEDKIINAAKIAGKTPKEIADFFTDEYNSFLNDFGIDPPTFNTRVTEFIPEIIKYIEELIEKGFAYATSGGNVYFDVSKKTDYGKLSGQKISEMTESDRTDADQDKKNGVDFALWKREELEGAYYKSPWGNGRPGWHIECSVMANTILGNQIDIHAGGLDLVFPHHENEIAQCEAHNNGPFANFWIHSGLLMVDNKKMSKSLGNFVTLKDAISKYGTEIIKYTILKSHYRSQINLSDQIFLNNINRVLKIYKTFEKKQNILSESKMAPNEKIISDFKEVMDNDFNFPEAIVIFDNAMESDSFADISAGIEIGKVFGFFKKSPRDVYQELLKFYFNQKNATQISLEEIESKISQMQIYKSEKNYEESDKIRNELNDYGIEIMQSGDSIDWAFKITT